MQATLRRRHTVLLTILCTLLVTQSGADAATSYPPVALPDVKPTAVLEGSGWGHGVGMSQFGAYAMSKRGFGPKRILKHYYPGTDVTRGVDTSMRIRVGLSADPPLDKSSSTWWHRQERVAIDVPSSGSAVRWRGCDSSGCTAIADQPPGSTWHLVHHSDGWRIYRPGEGPRFESTKERVEVLHGSAGTIVKGPHPWTSTRRADYLYGKLEVTKASSGMRVVSVQPSLEVYLRGLGEMPAYWGSPANGGLAALKVQAITARTYALKAHRNNGGQSGSCGCTLVATPAHQYWLGYSSTLAPTSSPWRQAVDGTKQRVLTYQGGLAETYYSSSHGGRSENIEDSWAYGSNSVPYLRSVDDPYSLDPAVANPRASWTATFSNDRMASALGLQRVLSLKQRNIDRTAGGTPRTLKVWGIDKDGKRVKVIWSGGGKGIAGANLRTNLGLYSQQLRRVGLAPYRDDDGGKYETEIARLANVGITVACNRKAGGDRYCPKKKLQRRVLAAMMVSALDGLEPMSGPSRFSDVAASGFYTGSIKAIDDARILRGCGSGKFCPKKEVTRAKLARVLVQGLEGLEPGSSNSPFSDVKSGTKKARFINAVVDAGIIPPCGDGTKFCPNKAVKRGQAARYLVSALTWQP